MSQILKKENCTQECYPKCPIYNVLQRRIGNWKITDSNTIEGMVRYVQKERCPDGSNIDTSKLNPANILFQKSSSTIKYGQVEIAWKPKDRNLI